MKTTIAKIMGVVLTAVTVLSLFAFALPASAAITPQTWTKQPLPGATGYVMPNDITVSGPIIQGVDGTLYVAVQDSSPTPSFNILKSTNGGRSWAPTGTAGQPTEAVTSLVSFGATNLYYTTATRLWRSTDNGASFINIAFAPSGTFNSMAVGTVAGRNIIVLGTTTNVFYVDESDPFFSVQLLGSAPGDFATVTGSYPLTVAVSPNFGTDRGVAAIAANGIVSYDVLGGAWGAIIGNTAATGAITSAAIRFTTDWNASTNANFYFGTSLGAYAFRGAASPTASTAFLLTPSSNLPSTPFGTTGVAKVVSLDVTGTFAAATIYAGLTASKSNVIYSTNSGISWSVPSKLYGPLSGKTYVLIANDFATSSKVYALVGGTGLVANDNSGFSYSVDKGLSFNQISLINSSISVINDVAASSGTTFVSTSYTGGTNPTPTVPAGSFVITAGSYQNYSPAPSQVTIAATGEAFVNGDQVILGLNVGSLVGAVSVTGNVTYNPVTYTLTYGNNTGVAIVTNILTTGSTVFSITAPLTPNKFGVTYTPGTGTLVTGSDPNWTATLANAGVVGTATTNTLATILIGDVVPTLPLTFSVQMSGAGFYNPANGVITFLTVGETATVTNISGSAIANMTVTPTWTTGTFATTPPTLKVNGGSNLVTTSGTVITIPSLGVLVTGVPGTNADSIWRWDGTNWERVFLGARIIIGTLNNVVLNQVVGVATMVRVSSNYATDKTVFIAAVGGITLTYSINAGQTWKAQTSNIGSTNGVIDRIDSLLVVDGNKQYVGSSSSGNSIVVRTTTNGVGDILNNAWTEVILKTAAGNLLTGKVTEISVASNGDLLAVVTDSTGTFVFKSTDAGVTFKALTNPIDGLTDAPLGVSTGAFVDAANDYVTTGNIFVTLGAGGVYRYPSTASAAVTGWLRVDGAVYDTNGAVVNGTGQMVAAGGPGSSAEGSGMVYATDSSATTQGVSRIRGLSTQAEALLGPASVTFTGLWASSVALGNVQLWTVGSDIALYTYVDTLGVSGGTVVVSNLISVTATNTSTATITWPALANATDYVVVVSINKINSLYGSTGAVAVSDGDLTVTHAGGALTATVKGMDSATTYYVSVWAIAPSSFIFGGASAPVAFTTPLNTPEHGRDLTPYLGASDIPVQPNFAWLTVPGATSYTLQITAATDVAFASPVFNSATIPAVTGPNATFNYTGTLSNNTSYIWRVKANGLTSSDWVYGNFTTIPAVTPPVVVTQTSQPAPTIIVTQLPQITVTVAAPVPAPIITITQPSYTIAAPVAETPTYIWIIVGVGALLTLAVIILIIRTRRVV